VRREPLRQRLPELLPDVPELELPLLPDVPAAPVLPEVPPAPDVPEVPLLPDVPDELPERSAVSPDWPELPWRAPLCFDVPTPAPRFGSLVSLVPGAPVGCCAVVLRPVPPSLLPRR
jgi:hypothetical protein